MTGLGTNQMRRNGGPVEDFEVCRPGEAARLRILLERSAEVLRSQGHGGVGTFSVERMLLADIDKELKP